MKEEEGERGCYETVIHGAIPKSSTDSLKSADSGKCISTQMETRDGLDRETSILEDTLNQSMTVTIGE